MKDLKVVENGLVPIYEDKEGRRIINAREMHAYLECDTRFNDWIAFRIQNYGFVEGEDFYLNLSKSTGGRPAKEYFITLDMGKELGMVENNERGREVRKYFIQCEKDYRASITPEERGKLDAELRRADAMLNNSRVRMAKFIRETVKEIWDYLSPEAKQAYSSHVVDTVSGQPGLIPLPVIERSYTATELAAEFGVSANKIGRIANANGLKRAEFGFEVLDKAVGHDKQVVSFRYNNKGKDAIRTLLQAGRA